jgi:hypothetical protein
MGLENLRTVDAIGIEKTESTVTMTIFDAWDWIDERAHLVALQGKINSYFDFVQSGQIYESYPKASGKSIHINLMTQFPIPKLGLDLLSKATSEARKLNITIAHQLYSGEHNDVLSISSK